jgi:hypothetical protein
LLGLKGTLSEAELSWFRQRAQAGLLSKARRGELVLGLAVGYIKAADGRIDKHPDRRVREAIAVVFRKFVEFGSARQVLLWLRQNEIRLPAASIAEGRELIWRLPVYQTIIKFLKNPIYAGAYAFGRTETHTVCSRVELTRYGATGAPVSNGLCCCPITTRVISGGKTTSATSDCWQITRR